MLKTQYQPPLIKQRMPLLKLADADIEYQPQFIDVDPAWELFESLIHEIDWRQERIKIFAKVHNVPRLSCWMADAGLDYRYSNITMHPVAWSRSLAKIRDRLQLCTQNPFNSVLINYYRDGQDSNGWHSDDEPELGIDPVIASISLGAARDFQLRHKLNKQLRQSLSLEHGSLLLMKGSTQRYWQHQIPKRAKVGARINLTFRCIKVALS